MVSMKILRVGLLRSPYKDSMCVLWFRVPEGGAPYVGDFTPDSRPLRQL